MLAFMNIKHQTLLEPIINPVTELSRFHTRRKTAMASEICISRSANQFPGTSRTICFQNCHVN